VLEKISKLSLSSIPFLLSFLISNENEKNTLKLFCTDASLRFISRDNKNSFNLENAKKSSFNFDDERRRLLVF
jgi:hypothetical protein